jgi:ribosomal protein S27E
MGMFDYVNVSIKCPECGGDTTSQSKDGDCLMDLIDPTQIAWFRIYCNDCRTVATFSRPPRVDQKARSTPYSLEEVMELGYSKEATYKPTQFISR